MQILKILCFLVLFLFSTSGIVFAEGATGTRNIDYVEVLADGSVIIQAVGSFENPDFCSDPNRIIIPADNVYLDRYYASILTAFSGNLSVWAWVDGCQTMGWGEVYPIVKNVAILR